MLLLIIFISAFIERCLRKAFIQYHSVYHRVLIQELILTFTKCALMKFEVKIPCDQ